MDRAGDDFFAGPALAGHEDRRLVARCAIEHFEQIDHAIRRGNDGSIAEGSRHFTLQELVSMPQLLAFMCFSER